MISSKARNANTSFDLTTIAISPVDKDFDFMHPPKPTILVSD